VPRERFLPEAAAREGLEAVYQDRVVLTRRDERGVWTSSSSQPAIMALMLERLDVRRGQRVLEVGAGTGYNAALLTKLVEPDGRVVSVELEPDTARAARRALAGRKPQAKVVQGDGRQGWPPGAPYDRIIVTASASGVAPAWFEQLEEGGLLELPLWVNRSGQTQAIVTFQKLAGGLRSVAVLCGGFMPMREAPGAPAPAPGSSLSASERLDDQPRPLVHLSGEALKRLSAQERRRLLSLALSEPRVGQLGLRAPRGSLLLYLTLQAPQSRFVGGWKPGLISADGHGLAHLAGAKTFTRIEAYGDSEPEQMLRRLIEDWSGRGRPTEHDLRVEVSFEQVAATAPITWSWEK
jgi:protein-L-isoaspartate(D-aspartate) O-methyltransferase